MIQVLGGTVNKDLPWREEIGRACVEAAAQEEPEEPQPETKVDLPQAARELIRELAVEPQGLRSVLGRRRGAGD